METIKVTFFSKLLFGLLAATFAGISVAACTSSSSTSTTSSNFCNQVSSMDASISSAFSPAYSSTSQLPPTQKQIAEQDLHLTQQMNTASAQARDAANSAPSKEISSKFNGFSIYLKDFANAGSDAVSNTKKLINPTNLQIEIAQKPLTEISSSSPVMNSNKYFSSIKSPLDKACPAQTSTRTS